MSIASGLNSNPISSLVLMLVFIMVGGLLALLLLYKRSLERKRKISAEPIKRAAKAGRS
jgi:Flp pilus assembly protein protease CpaA